MDYVKGILQGAPLWVWPLLVVLLIIGLRATQDRTAPVWLICVLPVMGISGLGSVRALPDPDMTFTVFVLAYGAGAAFAFPVQRRWIIARQGALLRIKGEWLTLSVLMIIFWANFVGGTVQVISPATYHSALFQIVMSMAIGVAAGSFLGRAIGAVTYRTA